MIQTRRLSSGLAASMAVLLAACGGGDNDGGNLEPGRGELYKTPPTQLGSVSAAQFNAQLASTPSGSSLLKVAGPPKCGIDVRYLQYGTVGAKNEKTTATGALFVPTGSAAGCSGARPILLYAHETSTDKTFNIAALGSTDNPVTGTKKNPAADEAAIVAAIYAAQGYIVVAPNYAGYEASTLGYHPYLNADQQSKDMIDALSAARTALDDIDDGTTDNGKLFITGYSAGGHVAMATHRALQEAGKTVTASAGSSGPYAMATLADAIFTGSPNFGGTAFAALLVSSWQHAYGNLYSKPSELYTAKYSKGIESLLPSLLPRSELFAMGKLPLLELLGNDSAGFAQAQGVFRTFYGPPATALLKTSYADKVTADIVAHPCPYQDAAAPLDCKPAHPLRVAAKTNDLRTWTPAAPLLMCGGNADPRVYYVLAQQTQAYFQDKLTGPAKALTTLVDVDSPSGGPSDPFGAAKDGFAQAKAAVAAAAGDDPAAQAQAVYFAYHSFIVPPFCNAVARGFFSQF